VKNPEERRLEEAVGSTDYVILDVAMGGFSL